MLTRQLINTWNKQKNIGKQIIYPFAAVHTTWQIYKYIYWLYQTLTDILKLKENIFVTLVYTIANKANQSWLIGYTSC